MATSSRYLGSTKSKIGYHYSTVPNTAPQLPSNDFAGPHVGYLSEVIGEIETPQEQTQKKTPTQR